MWMMLVCVLAVLFWLRGALYRRLVVFPKEEREWNALRAGRKEVAPLPGWREFRGMLHSHSELSHDSEVPFPAILQAMKESRTDFICMSDHCVEGKADFSWQWRGLHEGRLFIPGFEMKEGLMPFGVAGDVVLGNGMDGSEIARKTVEHGGVLFYAHPEEPRVWERSELTGMEIYNIHADTKDEGNVYVKLLPDVLVSQGRYPEHVFRLFFDRPVANLRHWDEMNQTRHLTGIAGNDCHQNNGVRGIYTAAGTLRVEDTSPKTIKEFKLNAVTRWLAGACFGPLTAGRQLFGFQLDPYARMGRFVGTHVLSRELTEPAILDSLRAGRAFVGFDLLVDSAGFEWWAEHAGGNGGGEVVVMGESVANAADLRLRARSPVSCRFTVVKDGQVMTQKDGVDLEYTPVGPGRYRVEAELTIRDVLTPWVYTNPIWVK